MQGYLSPIQWAALEQAEVPLYRGEHGAHAYTSVVDRQDGAIAFECWQHARFQAEACGLDEELAPGAFNENIAARVAAALAVLAFGADFLPSDTPFAAARS